MNMQQQATQRSLEESLSRYVAMPTIPTDVVACSAAIKSLSTEFQKLGMVVQIDGPVHPWLIATTAETAMQQKRVKVLFAIHFDTVPVENEGHLTMRATKDKLYGRGVYDMKFAAACVKEMVSDFAKEKTLSEYDFGILITTDEEKGGYDGVFDFLQRGWTCDIAVVPDGGWNWSLEGRAKGFIYTYLTAHGRAAHSSRPWTGDNPISRLTPAIDEINQALPAPSPDGLTAVVVSLETSNGALYHTTQMPSWAKAGISVRAFTEQEMQSAIDTIKAIADKHKITMEITLHDAPVHLMSDNPLVQEFKTVAEEIHGGPIKLTDALAASDARHFATYNLPTVLMYPNGGDHHGPHEWIARHDLYKYYKLCKIYVQRVAHTGAPQPKAGLRIRLSKYRRKFSSVGTFVRIKH